MKFLIIFVAVVAVTLAKPSVITPFITGVSSQYLTQNTLGEYSYGYSNLHSAKAETRSLDGVTKGGFSYIDPLGEIQTVQYSADNLSGFRVLAATNLPVAPALPAFVQPAQIPDTKEVAEAKAKHLALLEEVKKSNAEIEKLEKSNEKSSDDKKNNSTVVAPGLNVIHTQIPGAITIQQTEVLPASTATLRNAPLPLFSTLYGLPTLPAIPALELPAFKAIPNVKIDDKGEKPTENKNSTVVVTGLNVIHTEIPGAITIQQNEIFPASTVALRSGALPIFPTLQGLSTLPVLPALELPLVKSSDKEEKTTENKNNSSAPNTAVKNALPTVPLLQAPLTYGYTINGNIVTQPVFTTYNAPLLLPGLHGFFPSPLGALASSYAVQNATTTTTTTEQTKTAEK